MPGIRRLGPSLRKVKRAPWVSAALLLLIWAGLPLIPEGWGLRFGLGYQLLFTAMLLLSSFLLWFLGKDGISCPGSTLGVLASVMGVILVTVGLLVAAGAVYPQFQRPQTPEAAPLEQVDRGKALFFLEQQSGGGGCPLCHAISGRGGTRGPDLTHVASRAGQRVSGLTAEEYLLEKVNAGASSRYQVPGYVPIMPPFGRMLSEQQIEELVAYLLSLE
jgi:mono/diheme cytochrome c family protein